MKKQPKFKGVNPESYSEDAIVWALTEEMFQQEAETMIGRSLTDKEFRRISFAIAEYEEINWKHMVLIKELVEAISDNSKHQWDDWDK